MPGDRYMNENLSYDQILRTVGQVLEGLNITSFTLNLEGHDFTVSAQQHPGKRLRVLWQRLHGRKTESQGAVSPSSGVLELHYTVEDIARMDSEGRAKRGSTAGTLKPHSLSQLLRAVAYFVDREGGHLLTVHKDHQNINFEYKTDLETKVTQEFTVPALYDLWVKMYLERSDR
jgi:hypothetical protein